MRALGDLKLDELGLVLDIDPRKMSQQGQMHPAATAAAPKTDPDVEPADNDDDDNADQEDDE